MPAVRCKHYSNDGFAIGRGCTTHNCRYIHPDDRARWESLPPYWHKVNTRCKHFDDHGRRVSVCSNRQCRFVHPDDPLWARARPPDQISEKYPMERPQKPSASGRVLQGRADSLVASGKPKFAESARTPYPRLQPDFYQGKFTNGALPSRTTETVPESHPSSRRTSDSKPVDSQPIRVSPLESMYAPPLPSSAISQTGDDAKHRALETLMWYLSQAVDLQQKMRDIDIRVSLHAMNHVPASTSSDNSQLGDFLCASRDDRRDVEKRLEDVITQVTKLDFWPIVIAEKPIADPEQIAPFFDQEKLTKRLDEVEAQLKMRHEIDRSVKHIGARPVVTSADGADTGKLSYNPRKRRRTSPSRRSTQTFDVMDRLDRAESKISEMEREAWNSEFVSEQIEELIERTTARSTMFHSRGKGAKPPRQPIETLVGRLSSDFTDLCSELAEQIPIFSKQEAELGHLRMESETLKQNTTSLELSIKELHEEFESLSRQARQATAQIIKRQDVLASQPSFANQRDSVIQTVTRDVRQRISITQVDLETLIASQFKDTQDAVLTKFESTMAKTDAVYDAVARKAAAPSEQRHGVEGSPLGNRIGTC